VATGGPETYAQCQAEARRIRRRGAARLHAPSAALKPGAARGVVVNQGPHPAPDRDGLVIVAFGLPQTFTGWAVADEARPPDDLLDRVRHVR
jgi:hypothetical protein